MSPRRSGTGRNEPLADWLSALFRSVADDRDGFSARDVLTIGPRVTAALRSMSRTDAEGNTGVPRERLRELGRQLAPRLPLRDHPTLVRHHNGRIGDELASALVRNAAATTSVVGLVGGSLVFVTTKTPAGMASIPVRLAAEALIVGAVEVKLIAELCEAYGRPLGTTNAARGREALALWGRYRGLDGSAGAIGVVGQIVRRPAQRRAVGATAGRVLGSGAARLTAGLAGGADNRRRTLELAELVRAEMLGGGRPLRSGPGGFWPL